VVAMITFGSGTLVALRMYETSGRGGGRGAMRRT
jgi:hypothetical protein